MLQPIFFRSSVHKFSTKPLFSPRFGKIWITRYVYLKLKGTFSNSRYNRTSMCNRNLRILQFPVSQILTVYRRSVLVTHIHNVYVLNFTFLINEEPVLVFSLLKCSNSGKCECLNLKNRSRSRALFTSTRSRT